MRAAIPWVIALAVLVLVPGISLASVPDRVFGRLDDRLEVAVARVRSSDSATFVAHAAVGRALTLVRPEEAGLQWFKAAAHAQTEEEMRRSAAGIRNALRAGASAGQLEESLCPKMLSGGPGAQKQREAINLAGLTCG
jgi:hypothetical protein